MILIGNYQSLHFWFVKSSHSHTEGIKRYRDAIRALLFLGPLLAAPTDLESLPTPISLLALKGRCRRRGSRGRVFITEGEATHRAAVKRCVHRRVHWKITIRKML